MKTKSVLAHFGGHAKTASAIGYTRQAIYKWGDTVPEQAQPRVALASGGRFQARVSLTRRKLAR